jgi:hypothetical protein
VAAQRAAALEREANDAACAVLQGQRVAVPPRDDCPSIQPWDIDMHLTAVYWTGRTQRASHVQASRAALASQSLDDSEHTDAPSLKVRGITDLTGLNNRFANNAHALGVSFAEFEVVARDGIARRNELLFGLGLHTVGDFLAHANLSGACTAGHQVGFNEDGSDSHYLSGAADETSRNPRKALDTIARFVGLWANFLRGPPVALSAAQQDLFVDFVLAPPATKEEGTAKGNAFRKGITLLGVAEPRNTAEITAIGGLRDLSALVRNVLWQGGDRPGDFLTSAERIEAESLAWEYWLRRKKGQDRLFRCGVDDVRLASGSWGNFTGGYSSRVPIPRPYPEPGNPPLFRDSMF